MFPIFTIYYFCVELNIPSILSVVIVSPNSWREPESCEMFTDVKRQIKKIDSKKESANSLDAYVR